MNYIAYGSNMNLEQMAYRCPGSRVVGKGELHGWKLVFNVHADILPGGEEDVTPVVVWKIAPEDWRRLDRYEGYPRYYVKEEIETYLESGENETCIAYVMAPSRKGYAPPDDHYFRIIEEGYQEHGLDTTPLHAALDESYKNEFPYQY